ncbi:MAG: UDP-N-acetylglucosamine 2-epimerase (non-hydrolyzing) [bacterium]|nr:UDP-N-acetylglucosamine 2-epimerase (non-hydrolyzing) [bacterium]
MARKLLLVAAARPNFMKIAPLWRALRSRPDRFQPKLVHTGQHYDKNMSDVFFDDLGLSRPDVNLGIGGGSHGQQTAGVLEKFERLCLDERPDMVVVVGDVNATLAATVAACKIQVPVAHIEAGLRSGDRSMPEELNRLMTDAVADLLFTPSPDADENLLREGVSPERIRLVGNIMIDSLVGVLDKVRDLDTFARMGLEAGAYGVVTLHRPSNVDAPEDLASILQALDRVRRPLVFPVHPRTRNVMEENGIHLSVGSELRLTGPLGYYDFMNLVQHAEMVITDSGGIQEETTYLGIPCLTLRPNTERPITITQGTNELVTVDSLVAGTERILSGTWKTGRVPDLWDGRTGERIAGELACYFAR